MSSSESHLCLLDSAVCSSKRLREGELCCLQNRKKVSVLSLLYKFFHRADYPVHEYLNHFIAARNTRASAALSDLALVIPIRRNNQFSLSFLLAAGLCGTCCRRLCSALLRES